MSRRRWILLVLLALLALAGAWAGLTFRPGHVIRAEYAPNHGADFDFHDPPCEPAGRPATRPGDVLVRYLGTSGVYIEYGNTAVLTAPFFSNYHQLRVAFGRVDPDLEAIEAGLAGLPLDRVRVVLVGHTHYDHFADLPVILRDHVRGVEVYTSPSGIHMLRNCDGIDAGFVDLTRQVGQWRRLADDQGNPLPVRILPLDSTHAPHTRFYRFAPGEITEPWDCLTGKRIASLKQGRVYAFLIDLLDREDRVVFRVHYQDASSGRPNGFPPASIVQQRPVDLAIACMPSSWMVEAYPEGLLEYTHARHMLVTHYEDFFRAMDRPLRFVPSLTDAKANDFLRRARDVMQRPSHPVAGPRSRVCGPASDAWSMPLPGEWLRFSTESETRRE